MQNFGKWLDIRYDMTASLRLREGKMEGKGDKVGLDAEIVGVASSESQEHDSWSE